MLNGPEKSDAFIVARKPANAAGRTAAESVERRKAAEGNAERTCACRTPSRESAVSGLDRVRARARQEKKERFTALLHHVSVDRLRGAYAALKRQAAPGVDGLTWGDYEAELEGRLLDLHTRVHRGSYRPQPSRRTYIPKGEGRRPLGIAALEDKIVQRAVVEVLNAIYEQDFLGFSYGFRPGRSQHDALDALAYGISRTPVNYIVDCDIRSFFDTVSHEWLIRFVEHRIGDPRVIRLVRQWLKAGVLEGGVWSATEMGTPQGAVISPLLANVYLHYVFDLWAAQWRRRAARGHVVYVRYADDTVAGFEHRDDAERFLTDLRERLGRFALTLHPTKTRLIAFGRRAAAERQRSGRKPETFDFLGFTHLCGRSRAGRFQLQRTTRRDRMQAALKRIGVELAQRRHEPVPAQGRWLAQVVRGYFAYHAVPTNGRRLSAFHHHVKRLWLRTLKRRSQRDVTTWRRIAQLAAAFLPSPRILHPWPDERFLVTHPRWEPSARVGPARFCAGGAQ